MRSCADDVKYRQKYKELKAKLAEIEEVRRASLYSRRARRRADLIVSVLQDNTKLSVKILKSKKAIQRLRIERS